MSWWPGDGHANDIVGQNHGTPQNGATFARGLVQEAFSFDGVDDYVQIANEEPYDFGSDPFSITVWLKTPGGRSFNEHVFSKGRVWSGNNDYVLWVADAAHGPLGQIVLEYRSPTPTYLRSTKIVNDDQWHFVTVTQSGPCAGCANLYVDGALEDTQNGVTLLNGNDPFIIGAVFTTGSLLFSFKGLIDELEIYSRALSASEIRAIFDAGRAGMHKPNVCVVHKGKTIGIAALALRSHLAHDDVQVACPS